MNTKVYLDKSDGFNETMDSLGDLEEDDEKEEEREIYEKMEKTKKEQMKELEKMRGDFQRDLELHKLIVRSLGYVKRRKSIIMVMVKVKMRKWRMIIM
ncbi:hypothetical protein F2Q70_00030231 [Brassica cretica]|uniref:Uncharacterized protein n=1 Tax=Brassica cretica TaxID=69181 RepID=A0A3N6S5P2_BRACR|nr:hypothetical protein F2Q70_00030231 [Brassica cretica]